MKKKPQQDLFLRYITRANQLSRLIFPPPVRWLLAAIISTAIAYWFWSPLWHDTSPNFGGGHWVPDQRRGGSHMSGGYGIVLGIGVTFFALWSWIQVVRTTCSAIRNRKKH